MESKAFAKINLHLEVLNKRQDGYHEIFSLMAEIGIFDLLKLVKIRPCEAVSVSIIPEGGIYPEIIKEIPGDDNLITRAVRAYCRKADITGEYVFSVEKNIPSGSGMGGGSADAAAALRLMNARFNRLSPDELALAALETGADVPFCLEGGIAICRGTGEKIEKIDARPDWTVAVADMGIHVDTQEAYAMLGRGSPPRFDESAILKKTDLLRSALKMRSLKKLSSIVKNDFEEVIFDKHPRIKEVRDRLLSSGAGSAFMTGSGSAIVGLFDMKNKAEAAIKGLSGLAKSALVTGFADRKSPG